MKALRSLLIASLLAVGLAAPQARAADESPFKFEFHGFVTGSLYRQDNNFGAGSGQGLLMFAPTPANSAPCKTAACDAGPIPAGSAAKSGSFVGGDVRQSRYIFALSGPKTFGGATPKAYIEGDLFGPGPSGVLTESWVWRIRAAYGELKWTNATFQAGQFAANTAFAQMPDSVAHIANPLSFGAGNYGWRQMGFRGLYNIPLDGVNLELAGTISGAKAPNENGGPAGTTTSVSWGFASGVPNLEFRAKLDGKAGDLGWMVYGDLMFQSADLKGFGETAPNGYYLAESTAAAPVNKTKLSTQAYELGGKFTFAPVYLAFNLYSGKGLSPYAGALLQAGEINELGYWVSAGAFLTKEFGLNLTYGSDAPKEKDVRNWAAASLTNGGAAAAQFANAAMKTSNKLIAAQAKYSEGGYVFALEYINYKTKYVGGSWAQYQGTAPGLPDAITTSATQIILTAGYFF